MHRDICAGDYNQQDRRFRNASRWTCLAAALWSCAFIELATAKALIAELAILPAMSTAIPSDGPAEPTPAWTEFCQHHSQECSVDASEPAILTLDQDTWLTLSDVNARVNGTILTVTDQDHWGVVDRWDYPDDGIGDCEDIQLNKRKLLIEAGLPRRALRMTVVIDEQGMGHAVLMVRTDYGDFNLDNKRDAVLAWQQTGYLYVKREGDDGSAWVWLGGSPAPILTATK